ncbi:MAG: hypothetical protein KI793_04705 [Rivularia sp. (in: Bacteria)]|nr:hypothetical protein [Rivularia sp. MS3]
MNYLVAVFPDRMIAEEAFTALEKKGIKSTILGRGYKSADEFGLIDPKEQAKKQAKFMSFWLVPFGFFAGLAFNLITGLNTFAWAGDIGNPIIGGLLGAGSGALGAIFVGGGVGLVTGSGDALPYRNRLDAGKYIVVVEGAESLNRETTRILRQLEPENLQGYAAE